MKVQPLDAMTQFYLSAACSCLILDLQHRYQFHSALRAHHSSPPCSPHPPHQTTDQERGPGANFYGAVELLLSTKPTSRGPLREAVLCGSKSMGISLRINHPFTFTTLMEFCLNLLFSHLLVASIYWIHIHRVTSAPSNCPPASEALSGSSFPCQGGGIGPRIFPPSSITHICLSLDEIQ